MYCMTVFSVEIEQCVMPSLKERIYSKLEIIVEMLEGLVNTRVSSTYLTIKLYSAGL